MQLALELAWIFKGTTSPNPTVGAVLVKNNHIINTGVTQPVGGYHAERMALKDIPVKRSQGSTLYVTLEPCTFHGRTPACTDIILEKKIKRVVIAHKDPHSKVNGRGIEILRKAGISVDVGLYSKKAYQINQDFFIALTKKRPFVTLKYAMTLDGKMASFSGDSKWITHSESRKLTHLLRYRSDAIAVGKNTVNADDPTLNVRLFNREKSLLRVIFDPQGEVNMNFKVVQDEIPSLFVVKKTAPKEFIENIQCIPNKECYIDESNEPLIDLKSFLSYLYQEKKILSLFIEGGSFVLGNFLKEKCADYAFIFLGNQLLGEGLSPLNGFRTKFINEAAVLDDIKYKILSNNLLIHGCIKWKD